MFARFPTMRLAFAWQRLNRCAAVLLAALLLLGGAGCAARNDLPPVQYDIENWKFSGAEGREITTEHYLIRTTLTDDALLSALPELMERSFEYYRTLVPPSQAPRERMTVYLFATRPQWMRFTMDFTGPRAKMFLQIRNGGYSENGVTAIQYVAHQTTFPIMAHEGLHQYLHHYVNPNIPAWLNEGLAVICEGQRWTSGGLIGFDPWYNPQRRNTLAEAVFNKRTFPLTQLVETHAGRILNETTSRVGTYYAQLWALVLFLREGQGGKYAPGFQRLLESVGEYDLEQYARAAHIWSEGRRYNYGEHLFRCFITEDVETFEQEYLAFLRERMVAH
ncbi:hypothetical protein RAS1_32680 [Phycisphaerae bacterium RAS1]|nr:hypothetical protein RAS1_32680 [Phycisphaerae bacterium RAS1]